MACPALLKSIFAPIMGSRRWEFFFYGVIVGVLVGVMLTVWIKYLT